MRLPTSEKTILTLLTDRGPCYGLELVKLSGRRLTRGGIYVTLGRMEAKGLVTSEPSDAGRRLYEPTGDLGDGTAQINFATAIYHRVIKAAAVPKYKSGE